MQITGAEAVIKSFLKEVDLVNPDFVKIADSYCIPGDRVKDRQQLEDAVDKMLKSKGPYLLEVVVKKEENVFPMIPAGAAVDEILLEAG